MRLYKRNAAEPDDSEAKHPILNVILNLLPKNSSANTDVKVRWRGPKSTDKDYLVKTSNHLKDKTFTKLRDAREYRKKLREDSELFVRTYFDGFIYSVDKLA